MRSTLDRVSTGVFGFDEVLDGGLVTHRTYMLRGPPGAGKSILGLHFLEAGVEELIVEDGAYEATVQLPYDADVHTVLEALEHRYEDVDLLAQRERERSVRSRQAVWAEFRESLTDRQWSAVQTAYYAGFFDWPRTATGEEVAESLDISPATFHEHLRAAQRKLLAALLDG